MKRTSVVLLTSGALVAAITGTALAGGSDDPSPTRSASPSSASSTATPGPGTKSPAETPSDAPTTAPTADDTAPAATAPGQGSVSSRRAAEIALSHVGGGTVTEVESEWEHGRTVWSVKIVKNGRRYEVHVDRADGEITRSRVKADDGRADDRGDGRDDVSGGDDHGGEHDDDTTDDHHRGGRGDDSGRRGGDEDGGHGGRHHD